jgi:hypothetical protein
MIPTPKYQMGQVVYYPTIFDTLTELPCPDCKDTKQWAVTTPAGESFMVPCQRCCSGYRRVDLPSLTQRVWRASATALTVGQIKIETPVPSSSSWGDRDAVHYMCIETGIGSGSVYQESRLFLTEAEALANAEIEARLRTVEWASTPEKIRDRDIATLRLTDAFGENARSTIWSVGYHYGHLRETVEGWLESDSEFGASEDQRQSIRDAIRDMEWHEGEKQNPLSALVIAARRVEGDAVLAAALKPFAFVREVTKDTHELV